MSTTQVVVTYAQLQEAFHKNPAQLQDAVYRSADQAANGDAKERAQLSAAWNEAVSELQKGDHGDVMIPTSTPSSAYQWINLKPHPAAAGKLLGGPNLWIPALSPARILNARFRREQGMGDKLHAG